MADVYPQQDSAEVEAKKKALDGHLLAIEEIKRQEAEKSRILNKWAHLKKETKEHDMVLQAFEGVEPSRRCLRLVGDVLVERTVEEAEVAIRARKELLEKAAAQCEEMVQEKSKTVKELVDRIKEIPT
eukprot:GHVP01066927.1.p1 GENE.GHVP01066927.1~~GHVP01066927.1.p1  ORF type:complete len:128 (-),score=36.19 GHVP01066927.1:251-634(-)